MKITNFLIINFYHYRFVTQNCPNIEQFNRFYEIKGRMGRGGHSWSFQCQYLKSAMHCLKVRAYIYSINIFNNNFTKIKVHKKVYAGLETKMKN